MSRVATVIPEIGFDELPTSPVRRELTVTKRNPSTRMRNEPRRLILSEGASVQATTKALEAVGGSGYYRGVGLERLVRDSFAAQFHPFPEKKQQQLTGRVAIGLDPASESFEAE